MDALSLNGNVFLSLFINGLFETDAFLRKLDKTY